MWVASCEVWDGLIKCIKFFSESMSCILNYFDCNLIHTILFFTKTFKDAAIFCYCFFNSVFDFLFLRVI